MSKILPIVQEPERVLRRHAAEVKISEITSAKIKKIIADMKETLANTPDGVGLAASQIGESLQIFIVSEEAEEIDNAMKKGYQRRSKKEADTVKEKPYEERAWRYYSFINPVIKKLSKSKAEDGEGCLSVRGVYGTVKRHEKITVEAHDEDGKRFTRGASNFFARVLQHELDHLNGILFIDKAVILNDAAKS